MKKLGFTIIIAFFALFARSENEIPITPDPPVPEIGISFVRIS